MRLILPLPTTIVYATLALGTAVELIVSFGWLNVRRANQSIRPSRDDSLQSLTSVSVTERAQGSPSPIDRFYPRRTEAG
jgi:hypothetical protein